MARILVVDDSSTIRRLVKRILAHAHFEVIEAADGDDAIAVLRASSPKVDLVLLDFVMPRMNGFQVCRALRSDPALGDTPVVLMSAKSDRIREQFVQQTGALDAITKPFDAAALVAVVENVLLRIENKSAGGAPEPPPNDDLGSLPPPAASGHVALSGDLQAIAVGAILQLFSVESQTGSLVCTHGGREITATFRLGMIDLVQSKGAGDEFRLGRYFVAEGIVTADEIDSLVAGVSREGPVEAVQEESRVAKKPLLGDALLEGGRITTEQLQRALARQSSELLYEVLRWERGRFEFRQNAPNALAESTRLGMSVAEIVMEGFRRVDEWRLLESSLGSFDKVLAKDDGALHDYGKEKLQRAETRVLDALDGDRTIREVIAASHLSSFDACRILAQFLEARLVRARAARGARS